MFPSHFYNLQWFNVFTIVRLVIWMLINKIVIYYSLVGIFRVPILVFSPVNPTQGTAQPCLAPLSCDVRNCGQGHWQRKHVSGKSCFVCLSIISTNYKQKIMHMWLSNLSPVESLILTTQDLIIQIILRVKSKGQVKHREKPFSSPKTLAGKAWYH